MAINKWASNWTGSSWNKKYKWLINILRDVEHAMHVMQINIVLGFHRTQSEWLLSRKQITLNAGDNMEGNCFFTACGNINLYNQCGNQYRTSLRNYK